MSTAASDATLLQLSAAASSLHQHPACTRVDWGTHPSPTMLEGGMVRPRVANGRISAKLIS